MQNAATESYVNDATVTFTLVDSDGSNVAGAINVAMPYVAGSNGRYQGTLDSTVNLGSPGDEFDLEITAVSGALNGFRKVRCRADYKGAGV
jgi:hypothetical protein